MTTVQDLLPGDLVTTGAGRELYITSCPHPIRHHLLLVVWRRGDGTIRLGSMYPDDEAGEVQPIEPATRAARLANALG